MVTPLFVVVFSSMRTKIIAGVGDSSHSEEMVDKLAKSGMDIARINFSHCPHEEYEARVAWIKAAAEKCGRKIDILVDLQGPKIRLGILPTSLVQIEAGQTYIFSTRAEDDNKEGIFYIKSPGLQSNFKPGDLVLVKDGKLRFQVEKVEGDLITTKALFSGLMPSRSGINLPGINIGGSVITAKDREDLAFVMKTHKPDYVALSFVRSRTDIEELRALVGDSSVKLIAKLETPLAFEDLDGIIEASDAVMVARGDLGIEMPIETLPVLERKIIAACKKHGKPVIVATDLLSQMTEQPFPSRSNVVDISFAVWEGADMVMVSNETTSGKYIIESLQTLVKVIQEAENF